jgi:hypothetical protein
MIIYSATKAEFRDDVKQNRIEDAILAEFERRLGHSTGQTEVESWKNSMVYMSNVLDDDGIPGDAGVAIEYRIPQTSKRVDFILTGRNGDDREAAVIVELKQWSDVEATDMDGMVRTYVGGGLREVTQPSYQAWTYAALLRDFNENVQKAAIALKPCAYLHNLGSRDAIADPRYNDHVLKAPAFVREDAARLTAFIKQHIRHGDGRKLLFAIENSRIRPSKNLADELASMLQGNQEFVMVDDQKLVFERTLELVSQARTGVMPATARHGAADGRQNKLFAAEAYAPVIAARMDASRDDSRPPKVEELYDRQVAEHLLSPAQNAARARPKRVTM